MSRYGFITKDNKEVAYGFDRPLQEYFITVYDHSLQWREDNTEEQNIKAEEIDPSGEGIVLSWTTNPISIGEVKGRVDILTKLRELGCPNKRHLEAIAGDLVF